MNKGERLAGEVALVALYLRGAPHPSCCQRRRWPQVVDAVLRSCADLAGVPAALRAHGLWDEASVLDDSRRLAWALDVCSSGRALTYLHPSYPRGWVESLGSGAPPCVWRRGPLPSAPAVSVVGSRALGSSDRAFASGVGRLLMSTGRTLVSGGAVGADSVALDAALSCGEHARCVIVLPFGLDRAGPQPGVCQLSVCEPWAEFTTGQAMERNALIYSYGRRAVVVRARYREGGTWHGAVDALRRRLGAVYVHGDDEAARALCALGGRPAGRLRSLGALLTQPAPTPQPTLFGVSAVRDALVPYVA